MLKMAGPIGIFMYIFVGCAVLICLRGFSAKLKYVLLFGFMCVCPYALPCRRDFWPYAFLAHYVWLLVSSVCGGIYSLISYSLYGIFYGR